MLDQHHDLLLRTNSCLLPFLKQQHGQSIPYCDTLDTGLNALALFQKTSFSCLTPCILVYADLTLKSEDKYITNILTRYMFVGIKNTGERSGLFIHLPRDIELIDSILEYSLFSSIANFLGVASLFFGLSMFGCYESLMDFICWTVNKINLKTKKNKYIKTIPLATLIFTSTILLIITLAVFFSHYISSPTDKYVSIDAELPNISLSFCSSNNEAQLVNEKFYTLCATDLRKQISNFLIMNSLRKWSTVWNSSFPASEDENIFKSVIFPSNNHTLQFCKTIDLQSYPGLIKVRRHA